MKKFVWVFAVVCILAGVALPAAAEWVSVFSLEVRGLSSAIQAVDRLTRWEEGFQRQMMLNMMYSELFQANPDDPGIDLNGKIWMYGYGDTDDVEMGAFVLAIPLDGDGSVYMDNLNNAYIEAEDEDVPEGMRYYNDEFYVLQKGGTVYLSEDSDAILETEARREDGRHPAVLPVFGDVAVYLNFEFFQQMWDELPMDDNPLMAEFAEVYKEFYAQYKSEALGMAVTEELIKFNAYIDFTEGSAFQKMVEELPSVSDASAFAIPDNAMATFMDASASSAFDVTPYRMMVETFANCVDGFEDVIGDFDRFWALIQAVGIRESAISLLPPQQGAPVRLLSYAVTDHPDTYEKNSNELTATTLELMTKYVSRLARMEWADMVEPLALIEKIVSSIQITPLAGRTFRETPITQARLSIDWPTTDEEGNDSAILLGINNGYAILDSTILESVGDSTVLDEAISAYKDGTGIPLPQRPFWTSYFPQMPDNVCAIGYIHTFDGVRLAFKALVSRGAALGIPFEAPFAIEDFLPESAGPGTYPFYMYKQNGALLSMSAFKLEDVYSLVDGFSNISGAFVPSPYAETPGFVVEGDVIIFEDGTRISATTGELIEGADIEDMDMDE